MAQQTFSLADIEATLNEDTPATPQAGGFNLADITATLEEDDRPTSVARGTFTPELVRPMASHAAPGPLVPLAKPRRDLPTARPTGPALGVAPLAKPPAPVSNVPVAPVRTPGPTIFGTDVSTMEGALPNVPGPLGQLSAAMSLPARALAAPALAVGELAGTLPGHEAEPPDLLGRIGAHLRQITQGTDTPVFSTLGGLIVPPRDTGQMQPAEAVNIGRIGMGLPPEPPRYATPFDEAVTGAARAGVTGAAQLLGDPALVGLGLAPKGAATAVAFIYSAEGLKTAAQSALEGKGPEQVAFDVVNAAFMTLPLVAHYTPPIRNWLARASQDLAAIHQMKTAERAAAAAQAPAVIPPEPTDIVTQPIRPKLPPGPEPAGEAVIARGPAGPLPPVIRPQPAGEAIITRPPEGDLPPLIRPQPAGQAVITPPIGAIEAPNAAQAGEEPGRDQPEHPGDAGVGAPPQASGGGGALQRPPAPEGQAPPEGEEAVSEFRREVQEMSTPVLRESIAEFELDLEHGDTITEHGERVLEHMRRELQRREGQQEFGFEAPPAPPTPPLAPLGLTPKGVGTQGVYLGAIIARTKTHIYRQAKDPDKVDVYKLSQSGKQAVFDGTYRRETFGKLLEMYAVKPPTPQLEAPAGSTPLGLTPKGPQEGRAASPAAVLGGKLALSILKGPGGFFFAGSVPPELGYLDSPEDVLRAHRVGDAKSLRRRMFDTEAAAIEAARQAGAPRVTTEAGTRIDLTAERPQEPATPRDTMTRRGFLQTLYAAAKEDIGDYISDELMGDPHLVAQTIKEIESGPMAPDARAAAAKMRAWLETNGEDYATLLTRELGKLPEGFYKPKPPALPVTPPTAAVAEPKPGEAGYIKPGTVLAETETHVFRQDAGIQSDVHVYLKGRTGGEVFEGTFSKDDPAVRHALAGAAKPPALPTPTETPIVQAEAPHALEQPRPQDSGPLAGAPPEDGEGSGTVGPLGTIGLRGAGVDRPSGNRSDPSGREPRPGAGVVSGGVGVPAGRGGAAGPPERAPEGLGRAAGRGSSYRITDADAIGTGSETQRLTRNLAAIRLLKELEAAKRPATPAEQAVLVQYVGWGGLSNAFKPGHPMAATLDAADLLTDEERESAEGSTPNAHYTSPTVIKAIYAGLERLGLKEGRMLEPAAGIGHFLGLQPDTLALSRAGVELDAISGRIARLLYPDAKIQVTGFETAQLPDRYFDAVVSNVPFGDYGVHDPTFKGRPKKLTSAIHNYFFAKALDKTRPGGVVAFITSHHTLDAVDSTVREYLAGHAELLGAVRLPRTAFKGNAGTEVVTDIVFLKKRDHPSDQPESWTTTGEQIVTTEAGDAVPMRVNQYFLDHPEMVLGTHSAKGSMYRENEYTVEPSGDLATQLAAAMQQLPAGRLARAEAPSVAPPTLDELMPAPDHIKEDAWTTHKGGLAIRRHGLLEPQPKITGKTQARILGMIGVRDALRSTMRAMLTPESTDPQIKAAQKKLNTVYDAFVKAFGPLNADVNYRAFGDDPDLPLLSSLEDWDAANKTATKSAIFTKRTLSPPTPVLSAETPQEALMVTLNEKGGIDLAHMSRLTGMPEEELVAALAGLVYETPDGTYETADAYLSGNVVTKLEEAEAAAEQDAKFVDHVKALKAVQPTPLPPTKIKARLGASWIEPDDIQQFVSDLLGTALRNVRVTFSRPIATWVVESDVGAGLVASYTQFGTSRANALVLINDAMNLRTTTIYDTVPGGPGERPKQVVNTDETLAAREKQFIIKARFAEWLWKDHERATRLAAVYNHDFNNLVERKYDGAHLTLPGMAATLKLRPHQLNAIWRVIQSNTTLLAHVVGAGKTFVMAAAAMEMRRLGLAKKPMLVVPNHLIEQWGAEFIRLYPGAKLLIAGKKDFETDNRKKLMARVATGDWDAVVVGHTSFGKLPVSAKTFTAFLKEQIAILDRFIREYQGAQTQRAGGRRGRRGGQGKPDKTVKELVKARKRLVKKITDRAKREDKDVTVDFEDLGVDALFVDEAHMFKNLWFPTKMTRVAGLPNSEADRSLDMFLKTQYVQKRNQGRGVVFATGTPVSNSIAEVFTMQRYLQLADLEAAGLAHFDAWAQQYGEIVTTLELAPEGSGYRARTRFSRFANLPELSRMFRRMADVLTRDMLKLPIPKMRGGKPELVSAPASEAQQAYITDLVERAGAIRKGGVNPKDDNMLKVTGEGRKSALDIRLVTPGGADYAPSKVNAAVTRIVEIYHRTTPDKGAQLVFADLGTPQDDDARHSVYEDVRTKLLAAGIPKDQIAFIHDANTDARKTTLFNKVNTGTVRVLIGSTEKMGAGMNVQRRLVAEHHLDAPWRPADIEQREGRILRQGNELMAKDPDFAVEIVRYVTAGTFDAYMWQTLETKASYIEQFMKGDVNVREMEDVAGGALTYAEAKAVASGNPLVFEKHAIDIELQKLQALKRAFQDEVNQLRYDAQELPRTIFANKEALTAWRDLKGMVAMPDPFAIQVARKPYTKRADANAAMSALPDYGSVDFAGLQFDKSTWGFSPESVKWHEEKLNKRVPRSYRVTNGPSGLFEPWFTEGEDSVARLTNFVTGGIEGRIETLTETIARDEKTLADTKAQLEDARFPQEARFQELEAEAARIAALLDLDAKGQAAAAPAVDIEDEEGDDDDSADDRPAPRGTRGEASKGATAEFPPRAGTAQPYTQGRETKPIAFPELVGLARELATTPQVVKRFRGEARGRFGGGQIRLAAHLFKAGNEAQLAATLAHEIGHLADWLPDYTLKRGNILGRLRSLTSFLKGKFTALDGTTITNADVRDELKALSKKWRPFSPDEATKSFLAYRNSAKELYADALSVLLNNPGMLEDEAPTFYRQFFEHLDTKPEVKAAYFALQELLAGTPEELIARRRAGVRTMFEEGDTKAMDLERKRQAEARASLKDLGTRLRIQLVDKNTPLIDRVRALEKRGVRINPDDDPRYLLEERNYLGGLLSAVVKEDFDPIYQAVTAADIDWHTFGEVLFYDRIIAGDRSELANPRGISPGVATDLREDLLTALSADQRATLREQVRKFRSVVKRVAEEAHEVELYSDALYEEMQENPAYATFRVIDHIEKDVSAKVYQQIGTLKDVTNVADSTMLKILATVKAIERQKLMTGTFDFLTQYYPGDLEQAREVGGAQRRPIDPPDRKTQALVTYYEKGRLRGKWVDPYVADSLLNASVGHNWAVVSALRWMNNIARPLYTTFNLGFQTFNAARDFFRFWKNTPTMTLGRAVLRYWQGAGLAKVRAFGLGKAPSAADLLAYGNLVAAEKAKILSVTFNDLAGGRQVEDTQIEDILAKVGIGGFTAPLPRTRVGRVIHATQQLLNAIKALGDFIETLPKAAGIHEFTGTGPISAIPADKRSFIRRKMGSPDFLAGGTYKPITNEVLIFSNAITHAIRADVEVAREPTTRAGFWWKTAGFNIAPKLALFAALYLVGTQKDEKGTSLWARLRRALQGISEYDLTNYLPIPLGVDAKGNAIYLRLPQDDFGRLIGGLTWKALQSARGDREAMQSVMQVFDYMAGQAPSVAPSISAVGDVAALAAGQNVYDPFRNRFLFTEDELKARDRRTLEKFLGYEFQQLGGGIVWKFYAGETRPRQLSKGQQILDLPIVSNIVGRWLRITSFGQTEKLREAGAGVARDEARVRLDERDAVNEALTTLLAKPKDQQPAAAGPLAREVTQRLYGTAPPPVQIAQGKDIMRKLRMGMARGQADPLVDALLGATSNAQKVAILDRAAEGMSDTEFRVWMQRAMSADVVSTNLAKLYGQRRHVALPVAR